MTAKALRSSLYPIHHFLPVKSISSAAVPPQLHEAPHVQLPNPLSITSFPPSMGELCLPRPFCWHWHVSSLALFSSSAREQVHCPVGRWPVADKVSKNVGLKFKQKDTTYRRSKRHRRRCSRWKLSRKYSEEQRSCHRSTWLQQRKYNRHRRGRNKSLG